MSDVCCLHRETRVDGTYECVAAPGHDGNHIFWRLVQTVARDEP